jgi:hypothetical protein
VRAVGLTLDYGLLWIGVVLALVAAVFLASVPRPPSPDTSNHFIIHQAGIMDFGLVESGFGVSRTTK